MADERRKAPLRGGALTGAYLNGTGLAKADADLNGPSAKPAPRQNAVVLWCCARLTS